MIDDPFLARDLGGVIIVLIENDTGFKLFSIDVKDLYYSLPHDKLLVYVEDCIDGFRSLAFHNAADVPVGDFLELLAFYLISTFTSWNERNFIQRNGVCIRSCLAPVLSDIYLAHHDRNIQGHLDAPAIVKVCRFVDDFVIFIACTDHAFEPAISAILQIFKREMQPLKLLHKLPMNNSLHFLHPRLCLSSIHVR